MSTYDTVVCGTKEGQVKLWITEDRLTRLFEVGEHVPCLKCNNERCFADHAISYSIAMREGSVSGFVNIMHNEFISWTQKPMFEYVVDKWGDPFTEETTGLVDEPYHFRDAA